MFNPVSTYRIQFHSNFTFKNFERIIPYLHKLGVKTIYASPIFKSVPGSMHGYDGVDPLTINPEIGTLDELKNISRILHANGMSWLQDIVPNHMAFHPDNPWLMDVLENGPSSPYKNYFDQHLADEDFFSGSIMVPFLGDSLTETIDKGQLTVVQNQGKLKLNYAGQFWPLNAQSVEQLKGIKLAKVNADKALLNTIATSQYYRLCSWQETDSQINFRRFFTVNGLICLNIQRQDVFDHFHQLIKNLLQSNIIQGLRIDHIDGLYDPAGYLEKLRTMAGDETYIVVEKILEPGEKMEHWPMQGNTGYDFLATVNNLFTTRKSEEAFNRFYQSLMAEDIPVHQQIANKKAHILDRHMAGELDNLTNLFFKLNLNDESKASLATISHVKQAIAQLLIKCPVYRFYGNQMPLKKEDRKTLKALFKSVTDSHNELSSAVKILQKALLKSPKQGDEDYNSRALRFYKRIMQFTGPLMAKGVEDTLMYTYNRFIDHNEVGDAPDAFGISIDTFHKKMEWRQKHWPLSLNATATHDTKRGEDVRARLNVLTNLPDEWLDQLREWQKINFDLKTNGAPDPNDELFIYQTLIGAYPMPGQGDDDFAERLSAYLQKTLREGKQHSDWANPNEEYELSVQKFAKEILNKNGVFWPKFVNFHQKVADFGVVNLLSQTLLKLTCSGVPDVYQGCEHWDFSLVDPDNRRHVNYKLRDKYLRQNKAPGKLWEDRLNGQIKIKLVQTLLKFRAAYPLLFSDAEYLPLQTIGKHKDHILTFARRHRDTWLVIAIPLNVATICKKHECEINQIDWADTAIIMPAGAPDSYEHLLSGQKNNYKDIIKIQDIFTDMPLAALKLERPKNGRGSGVLMHITSLPSNFGVGDLGPAAKNFADTLHKAHQTYWQILPVSPTSAKDGHSPYSAYSSRAGNTLLISPELLFADGLLSKADIDFYGLSSTSKVDFEQAARVKNSLLDLAWFNFSRLSDETIQSDFEVFCKREADWLDDYALFLTIKQQHQDKAWHQWPIGLKARKPQALTQFITKNGEAITKAKWLQYIFDKQWQQLKKYCNNLGISLFGDLPFYMSYDSVDVWANPQYFSLNQKYEPETVAGVPPDYFNADGQLWGMPVYNWAKLKVDNYAWWVNRIRKNLAWFNLLRLDHFRAFSAYWAVPATDKTAINGTWLPGPGADLFKVLKKEFGKLPFVAEDLGEIDEPVRQLRDQFKLPGMKVLQFAFGDDLPYSEHAPHHHAENYLVYTGTHDNNTTRGWYENDINKRTIRQIATYTGTKIKADQVSKHMIQLAFASVCKIAIVPLQDLLNLDNRSRMNMPASTSGNWTWQATNHNLNQIPVKWLRELTQLYQR